MPAPPALIRLARSSALRELVCATTPTFVRVDHRAVAAAARPHRPRRFRQPVRASRPPPRRRRLRRRHPVRDRPPESRRPRRRRRRVRRARGHPDPADVGAARPGVHSALSARTCSTGCRTPTSSGARGPATWSPRTQPGAAELVWDWVRRPSRRPAGRRPLTGRLWDGAGGRGRRPGDRGGRTVRRRVPLDLLRRPRPAGPRSGRRVDPRRRPPGRPGRRPDPAGHRSDGGRVRLLAGRREHRRRRRRPRAAPDGRRTAQRRPRPRDRHPAGAAAPCRALAGAAGGGSRISVGAGDAAVGSTLVADLVDPDRRSGRRGGGAVHVGGHRAAQGCGLPAFAAAGPAGCACVG